MSKIIKNNEKVILFPQSTKHAERKINISVDQGMAFLIKIESSEIEELRNASKEYDIRIPDAEILITCHNGMVESYYSLKGYSRFVFAFGRPESSMRKLSNEGRAKEYAFDLLVDHSDYIDWKDILLKYLQEEGIEHEVLSCNSLDDLTEHAEKETNVSAKQGKAFFVTVASNEIEELRNASKKYEVQIPDAEYMITYCDGVFELYYSLEHCGISEHVSICPEGSISRLPNEEDALPLLMDNLNNVHWGNILSEHLQYDGIEYEEE